MRRTRAWWGCFQNKVGVEPAVIQQLGSIPGHWVLVIQRTLAPMSSISTAMKAYNSMILVDKYPFPTNRCVWGHFSARASVQRKHDDDVQAHFSEPHVFAKPGPSHDPLESTVEIAYPVWRNFPGRSRPSIYSVLTLLSRCRRSSARQSRFA